jgi:hypothetical protein
MSQFEYLLALVSILIGLAIADLSHSLHRLLRARRRVRWDWLPLAAALLVMLLILEFWWVFYGLGTLPVFMNYGPFLVLGASLVCMFLLASAALPDQVPIEGLELATYYRENARYIWILFATFVVLMILVESIAAGEDVRTVGFARHTALNLLFAGLLASLAAVNNRRYHMLLVPLLLVYLLWQWSRLHLG